MGALRRLWWSGCLPFAAIAAAPFLALLVSLDFGLLVAAAALALVAWLALDQARTGDARRRAPLLVAAGFNLALALLCLAAAVVRVLALG